MVWKYKGRSFHEWYDVHQRGAPVMDWLFKPLILLSLAACILGTPILDSVTNHAKCTFEECAARFNEETHRFGLTSPSGSPQYCQILSKYMACLNHNSNTQACRGDLNYHATVTITKKWNKNCRTKNGGWKDDKDRPRSESAANEATSTESNIPLPSCKYFGSFKFRHCTLFGDPHLKTFDGKYQTCRVDGKWTLIDNPYVFVQVTNGPVVEGSSATAPTKIVVVVKSRSTPCTLEKRYEADSSSPLPNTFVDGTDRPGADETVTLRFEQNNENRETVEIYMKYIATKLIIRRVGRYLSFSAKIPEEVVNTSQTYDGERMELCTRGCPAQEQLDLSSVREYLVSKERALHECKNTKNLSYDAPTALTDSYLDWCVFDVRTAGVSYDFIVAAHLALADARDGDPSSLKNRTMLLDLPTLDDGTNAAIRISFPLLPTLVVMILSTICGRYLL